MQHRDVASSALTFIARLFMVAAAALPRGGVLQAPATFIPAGCGRLTYAQAAAVRVALDAVVPELGAVIVERAVEAAVDTAPADQCSAAADAVLQVGMNGLMRAKHCYIAGLRSLRARSPAMLNADLVGALVPLQLLLSYGTSSAPAVSTCLRALPPRLSADVAASLTPAVIDAIVARMLALATAVAGSARLHSSPEAHVSIWQGVCMSRSRDTLLLSYLSRFQVFRRFMLRLRGVCQGSETLEALGRD
jgi:hypothetical protein